MANNDKQPGSAYHWIYERNMFRYPGDALRSVFKAFTIVWIICYLLIGIIFLCSDGAKVLWSITKVYLLVYPGVLLVSYIGYLIVALIHGGKYRVAFDMDERQIVHRQINKRTSDSDVVGWMGLLGAVALMAGGSTNGAALRGLWANSKIVSTTKYKDVKSITATKKHNHIRLNVQADHNDIFVSDTGFDFVLNFLTTHCPNLEK